MRVKFWGVRGSIATPGPRTARYGGRLGSAAHYRLYGKGFARDESALPDGQGASDDWHAWQGGYRVDWDPSTATHATVHGDLYDGRIGQPAAADIAVSGRNIVGRWTHTVSASSDVTDTAITRATTHHNPTAVLK